MSTFDGAPSASQLGQLVRHLVLVFYERERLGGGHGEFMPEECELCRRAAIFERSSHYLATGASLADLTRHEGGK